MKISLSLYCKYQIIGWSIFSFITFASLTVVKPYEFSVERAVQCIIDENGIGRKLSMKNKSRYESSHQSKGIGFTQSRLELDKLLNEREDKIFIIDKEGESGKSEGTKVIISFKEV